MVAIPEKVFNVMNDLNLKGANVAIACPHCSYKYNVPSEYIGQKAECENCNKHFFVTYYFPSGADSREIARFKASYYDENRTKIEGTFILRKNSYCFIDKKDDSVLQHIAYDILEAKLVTGKETGFLARFFGKTKIFFQIQTPYYTSFKYIVEKDVDLTKIWQIFNQSKKEENVRQTEEKIRQYNEKVRKRNLKEALRKKEAIERKQREEEEWCKKEKEERERREAEYNRRIEQKRTRIVELYTKNINLENECVEIINPRALSIILNNPYRILGISSQSSKNEATECLEKIKKLIRLKAISSYKTKFELSNIPPAKRELGVCQNALTEMREERFKWFWFSSYEGCLLWNNPSYLKELTNDGLEYAYYDTFLATYIYNLVYDSSLNNVTAWLSLFKYIDYTMENGKIVTWNTSKIDIPEDFISIVFAPFLELLSDDNDVELPRKLLRIYSVIKKQNFKNIVSIMERITLRLSEWFSMREKELLQVSEKNADNEDISTSDAVKLFKCGCNYINSVLPILDDIKRIFSDKPVRYEMIIDSFRKVSLAIMIELNKSEDNRKAIVIAKKTYKYFDKEKQRSIRITFGLDKNMN